MSKKKKRIKKVKLKKPAQEKFTLTGDSSVVIASTGLYANPEPVLSQPSKKKGWWR